MYSFFYMSSDSSYFFYMFEYKSSNMFNKIVHWMHVQINLLYLQI